jgi:hypothetical protein
MAPVSGLSVPMRSFHRTLHTHGDEPSAIRPSTVANVARSNREAGHLKNNQGDNVVTMNCWRNRCAKFLLALEKSALFSAFLFSLCSSRQNSGKLDHGDARIAKFTDDWRLIGNADRKKKKWLQERLHLCGSKSAT